MEGVSRESSSDKREVALTNCLNENCTQQLCGDTPNLIGAARASNVFVNAEVAEAASRCLAELMGSSQPRTQPLDGRP